MLDSLRTAKKGQKEFVEVAGLIDVASVKEAAVATLLRGQGQLRRILPRVPHLGPRRTLPTVGSWDESDGDEEMGALHQQQQPGGGGRMISSSLRMSQGTNRLESSRNLLGSPRPASTAPHLPSSRVRQLDGGAVSPGISLELRSLLSPPPSVIIRPPVSPSTGSGAGKGAPRPQRQSQLPRNWRVEATPPRRGIEDDDITANSSHAREQHTVPPPSPISKSASRSGEQTVTPDQTSSVLRRSSPQRVHGVARRKLHLRPHQKSGKGREIRRTVGGRQAKHQYSRRGVGIPHLPVGSSTGARTSGGGGASGGHQSPRQSRVSAKQDLIDLVSENEYFYQMMSSERMEKRKQRKMVIDSVWG